MRKKNPSPNPNDMNVDVRMGWDLAKVEVGKVGLPQAAQVVKNPPAMQETRVRFLGQEGTLEKRMATRFTGVLPASASHST